MGEHREFARVLKCGVGFMEFVCFVRSHLLWAMYQHICIAQRWRGRNCGISCACWHLGMCHPVENGGTLQICTCILHFEGFVWSEILTSIRWWFLKLWGSCHCIFSAKTFSQTNNVIIGMMEQIHTCVWHFDACRPGRATDFLAWWPFWN